MITFNTAQYYIALQHITGQYNILKCHWPKARSVMRAMTAKQHIDIEVIMAHTMANCYGSATDKMFCPYWCLHVYVGWLLIARLLHRRALVQNLSQETGVLSQETGVLASLSPLRPVERESLHPRPW